VLLLGNKSDLISESSKPEVTDEEIDAFVTEHSFFAHFICSAKSGENIKAACNHLVMQIAENNKQEMHEPDAAKDPEESQTQNVKLEKQETAKPEGGGCCG